MILRILPILGVATLVTLAAPAAAGPCAGQIDAAQASLDARIDAIAGAGRMAPESRDARLHHQPTPGSIAGAERRLGEGRQVETARAALARARAADNAGDTAGCERALGEVRQALQ